MNDLEQRLWDKDVQDIADQLVFGVSFEQGVRYVGEMADLVMEARARLSRYEEVVKAARRLNSFPVIDLDESAQIKAFVARHGYLADRLRHWAEVCQAPRYGDLPNVLIEVADALERNDL